MNVPGSSSNRFIFIKILLLALLLFATAAYATNVRFNGVTIPPSTPFDITTQGYIFRFIDTPSTDEPTILPAGPSPHGSNAYALCGYCYATSTFTFSRSNSTQFDLASMELGASGNPSDEFDFTITGYLWGGGTVVHNETVTVTTGLVTVNFNSSWRDLASVDVSIDNTGNGGISISSVDNIHLHQPPVITYANVPVTDGGGTNNDLKPVTVEGMVLDGVTYDLTVNWGTLYNAVYTTPPLFEWTQFPPVTFGAQDTVDELRYALQLDSYVPLPPLTNGDNGAFVLVPGATAWGAHWGGTIELDTVGLNLNDSFLFPIASVIDYIGWVRFATPPQLISSLVESGNVGNKLHPHHDGSAAAVAGLNDRISVVVYGTSEENGDLQDFFTGEIEADTVRFGPAQGGMNPSVSPEFDIDADGDGNLDARFHFLTGDAGLACSDTDATLVGMTTSGDEFQGVDSIITACDAQCH